MRAAVESLDLPADLEHTLWEYLQKAAYFMVNTESPVKPPTTGLTIRSSRHQDDQTDQQVG